MTRLFWIGLLFLVFGIVLLALVVPLRCLPCAWVSVGAKTHQLEDGITLHLVNVPLAKAKPLVEAAAARAGVGDFEPMQIMVGAGDRFAQNFTEYGVTHFSPWGGPFIVIGPKGTNVDVLAHEIMHARQFHRWGYIGRETSVPTWLDEGWAMQVDYRGGYGLSTLCTGAPEPVLAEIATAGDFFVADLDQRRRHYAYAKLVVADWVERGLLDEADLSNFRKLAFLAQNEVPKLCG